MLLLELDQQQPQLVPMQVHPGQQLVLKEQRRHFHDVLQRSPFFLAPFRLRVRLRHCNAGHIGHLLHRLDEAQAFEIGEKTEMVARHAAAEAVIAPLAVLAVEARALLPMEGAAALPVAPRPGEPDPPPDHRRDRRAPRARHVNGKLHSRHTRNDYSGWRGRRRTPQIQPPRDDVDRQPTLPRKIWQRNRPDGYERDEPRDAKIKGEVGGRMARKI